MDGQNYIVESKKFSETHTQFDPERANREILDEKQRVPLFPKLKKPARIEPENEFNPDNHGD